MEPRFRKRASVVCVYKNHILTFHAVDPTSGREYYFLPGGGIEEGEAPWQTAQREAREETGFEVKIDSTSEFVSKYPFLWDGNHWVTETYFYRGELILTENVDVKAIRQVEDAAYNRGAHWRPIESIEQDFSYIQEVKDAVLRLIQPPIKR